MLKRILFAFLLATSAAFSQNLNNFPWWNHPPLVAELKLSENQTQKIHQIVHSYRNRLLDARNSVQKAEGDLADIMNDQTVDTNAAKPVIDRLATSRANAIRVFTEMSVELRSVLTLDQWRQLVRRWDEQSHNANKRDTETTP